MGGELVRDGDGEKKGRAWDGMGGRVVDMVRDKVTHLNRVVIRKHELETIHLILVDGVVVNDAQVHEPFLEVVGLDERQAGGEVGL